MKKFLIASTAIAVAITGCASNQTQAPTEEGRMMQGKHEGRHHGDHDKHGKHEGHGKGKPGKDNLVANYTCTDGATVIAKYNPKDDNALLTINAPTWKLTNQDITFKSAVSGSGMRFVNETNPQSLYEWHSNGRDGILTVKVNGQDHSLTCTGQLVGAPENTQPMHAPVNAPTDAPAPVNAPAPTDAPVEAPTEAPAEVQQDANAATQS